MITCRALRLALVIGVVLAAPVGIERASADASTAPGAIRTTGSLTLGHLKRTWLALTPSVPSATSAPVIVVLSGISATLDQETTRDGLVPLVDAGDAELVYPVGIGRSWNAGGCCGQASAQLVDDVGFLKALVAKLDPHARRPVYLVGYSNGGRLAYRVACTDPALFRAIAVMKAMPEPGCVVTVPQTFLQVDSTDDPWVAYLDGEPAYEQPAATTEIGLLGTAFGCRAAPSVLVRGALALKTWTACERHARLAFATYTGGAHLWPEGSAATPSGASLIWSFFMHTPLARPYFPPATPCSASWC